MLLRCTVREASSEIGTTGPQCRDVTPERRETAVPGPQDFVDRLAMPDRSLSPPDLFL